ncbi:nucleotide exchange factor GrpE [Chloroflexota bacterium]
MPKEELNNEVFPEVSEEDSIEELKKALAEEKEKAEDYLASWQRAQADFINYKRRNEQEAEERRKFSNSVLMLSFLPVLDDLERAIASVPPEMAEESWIDGVRLIGHKAITELEAQGLSHIQAVGEPFDPNLHEAVRQDKGEEGIVIEEVQKGYMFHGRVLRPSRVVVGIGEVSEENNGVDRA